MAHLVEPSFLATGTKGLPNGFTAGAMTPSFNHESIWAHKLSCICGFILRTGEQTGTASSLKTIFIFNHLSYLYLCSEGVIQYNYNLTKILIRLLLLIQETWGAAHGSVAQGTQKGAKTIKWSFIDMIYQNRGFRGSRFHFWCQIWDHSTLLAAS